MSFFNAILTLICFSFTIFFVGFRFLLNGFEGSTNEERREPKSDFDISQEDKKTEIGNLKKKAMKASKRIRRSVQKRKTKCSTMGIAAIEDVRDAEELQAARAFGKASAALDASQNMMNMSMIVDGRCIIQASVQDQHTSRGTPLAFVEKPLQGILVRVWALFSALLVAFFAFIRSSIWLNNENPASDSSHDASDPTLVPILKEFRPPCASPELTQADIASCALKRLGDLEQIVDMLHMKPLQMPCEKEELLNATVSRVDALEAELTITKKALHEVLIRQEELLAYMDRQKEA